MSDDMENLIKNILEKHNINYKKISKINIGFTNETYNIDNKYIVKLCVHDFNENRFKNEVNFIEKNQGKKYVLTLLNFNIKKHSFSHYYEVFEKFEGTTLYNVWHLLTETERESVIKQLCDFMKDIHSFNQTGYVYDWNKFISDEIEFYIKKANRINYFSYEELQMIESAKLLFCKYLKSDGFTFIHNDIHFDNILYNNGIIKIIDFERCKMAPIDFELSVFFRMVNMPKLYANKEIKNYVELEDYRFIPIYIKKYYPELLSATYLEQRLAIYNVLDFTKRGIRHPDDKNIKKNLIINLKKIINK
jgi:Phosphotransferase enzyme family.